MKPFLSPILILLLLPSIKVKAQSPVSIKNIEYKQLENTDPELLSLDVYTFPELEKKRPVVMYFHGGGWSIGDKSRKVENKLSLFQELGYVLVSVNYRLSPFPPRPNDSDRIKFPEHNKDVASAIKWVYDSISKYGGDPQKIVLMGHSAGAHLVSLTGTNPIFLEQVGLDLSDIAGVVSLDTACYDVPEMLSAEGGSRMYLNAFGDDLKLNKEASPILQVSSYRPLPPFLVVKRGSTARRREIENFIRVLQQNRVKVEVVDAENYSHGRVNNAIGDTNDEIITPVLIKFLKNCFHEKT